MAGYDLIAASASLDPAVALRSVSPNQNLDTVDALPTSSAVGEEQRCLYGASSIVSFLTDVSRTLGPESNLPGCSGARLQSRSARTPVPRRLRERQSFGGDEELLPRRREADNFLRYFWEIAHQPFPILHRTAFMRTYQDLWTSDPEEDALNYDGGSDSPIFLAQLNLVFAIGCQFTPEVPPERKSTLAMQHYERSRKLVPLDQIDSPSVSIVQLLLLHVQYLQSTKHALRCWNVLGVAIRTTEAMGLHLNLSSTNTNQIEVEIRRRLWYVCVGMDR